MRDRSEPNQAINNSLDYRPDIDGMRAIAVLAVIAFHINKQWIPGGFVGVDIFFVISGYLISAHIYTSAAHGKFSFVDFYFRRIRRIAPAMLVVIAATLLTAQLLMLPDDAKAAAKSAAWSLASLTNVYFWLFEDNGYFAATSNELPLLHLWSLSLEEQFYLVWPLFAVVLCRLRFHTHLITLTTAVLISTLIAQYSFVSSPAFAYYMLPTRGGELLIGAILALVVVSGRLQAVPQHFALPVSASGLIAMLASIFIIAENDVFPGYLALLPTIGAALLICGGGIGSSAVSEGLAVAPLRWVGKLSYPAYLWHWPLLAFYRYGYGEPSLLAGLALFLMTLILASLTYRYVEQPVRNIPSCRWKRVFATWAAISCAVGIASLVFVYADRHFPQLLDESYAKALAEIRAQNVATTRADAICLRKELVATDLTDAHCSSGTGAAPANRVLLFGDSNSAHYVGIVSTFAQHSGFRFRNLAVGSCPPIIGDVSAFVPSRRLTACIESQKIWQRAIAEAEILIMGGTWSSYEHRSSKFLPLLESEIRRHVATGKTVIILGKVPPILAYDRLCKEKALRYPLMHCETPSNSTPEEVAEVNKKLQQLADSLPNTRFFGIESIVCPGGHCSAYNRNKESLYFDAHHLSVTGSVAVGREIYEVIGVPREFEFISAAAEQPVSQP